jgi:hypothetical protein
MEIEEWIMVGTGIFGLWCLWQGIRAMLAERRSKPLRSRVRRRCPSRDREGWEETVAVRRTKP